MGRNTHTSAPGQQLLPQDRTHSYVLSKQFFPQSGPLPRLRAERGVDTVCGPTAPSQAGTLIASHWRLGGTQALAGEATSQCAEAITWLSHISPTCGEGNLCIMETPHNTMWKTHFKNRFDFHLEAKANSWICFSLLIIGRN